MKNISVQAFKEILKIESKNEKVEFINVCTSEEFKEKHIRGVKNLPLDELEFRASELDGKDVIYVHCKSGNRSRKAIEKLKELGVKAELVNVDGGLNAWEEMNFPVNSVARKIPIIRQVFIVAGAIVFISGVLSLTVDFRFIYIATFVGGGLVFAGITGWCGMAMILTKMPWNKK